MVLHNEHRLSCNRMLVYSSKWYDNSQLNPHLYKFIHQKYGSILTTSVVGIGIFHLMLKMRVTGENVKTYFLYILTILNVGMLFYLFRVSYVYVTDERMTYIQQIGQPGVSPLTNKDSAQSEIIRHDKNTKNSMVSVYLEQGENYDKIKNMTYGIAEKMAIMEKVEIIVYDLSKPVPKEAEQIECILAKNANPPYNICLHNNELDTFLSRGIRTNLVWEPEIQAMIKMFFNEHPTGTFLDLGANIGTHSLYAANLNKTVQVLAVEPFPKNVIRIHKAAHMNNVQTRFKVIMAPILNKRGPVVFSEITANIGGNGIVEKPSEMGHKGFSSKTILFDDITPFVQSKVAFLKMDIEAAECHAFKNADTLFATVDIKLIVIEILYTKNEGACCFEGMLKFLSDRNYKAFPMPYRLNNKNNPLDNQRWQQWTQGEVYFEKFYT